MTRRALAVLVGALVVALPAAGCQRSKDGHTSQVQDGLLRSVSVRGFTRVYTDGNAGLGSGRPVGEAAFVGPHTNDPGPLISGPHLRLTTIQAESDAPVTYEEALYTGWATARDGSECSIYVFRLYDGKAPIDDWHVPAVQSKDLVAGRLTLVGVDADCGP